MTGRQKILQVLKDIKRESEINPSPEWVEFKFNTSPDGSLGGSGLLMDDEEKRILIKIEQEGIIEIHLPDGKSDDEKAMLNMLTPHEFMEYNDSIWIKILPLFYRKYFWYNLFSLVDNKWNYINPFWILWQSIRGIFFLIEWLWNKSKIMTIIFGTLSAILVYDWSLAWKNLKIILGYIGIL